MESIELVIKIPEDEYRNILLTGKASFCVVNAIEAGTVLPKGHGDLIDVDDIKVIELEDSLHIIRHEKGDGVDAYIEASTIIEADRTNNEAKDKGLVLEKPEEDMERE